MLGSTEWVEKHADELTKKAVMYLNSDSTSKGRLGSGGSHILERFVNEVERDVADPMTGRTLLQMNRERPAGEGAASGRGRGQAAGDADRKDMRIGALGSGSDYTPFLQHLGIASANFGFGGEGDSGGVYHSVYDSFYWYTKFSDGSFVYGRTLSQIAGTAMLRMADADVIPYEFGDFAETAGRYADEVEKLHRDTAGAPAPDFAPLKNGVDAVKKSAAAYEAAFLAADISRPNAALDAALIATERALLGKGLPRRDWFRHRIYAPGFYTGYGVKTLPGIREAIEEKHWDEEKAQLVTTAAALTDMAKADRQRHQATGALGARAETNVVEDDDALLGAVENKSHRFQGVRAQDFGFGRRESGKRKLERLEERLVARGVAEPGELHHDASQSAAARRRVAWLSPRRPKLRCSS